MRQNKNLSILIILFLVICLTAVILGVSHAIMPANTFDTTANSSVIKQCSSVKEQTINTNNNDDFKDYVSELISGQDAKPLSQKIYVGGKALGLSFDGDGALVIGINEFLSENGVVSPATQSGIKIGDTILQLGGKDIYNSSTLSKTLQDIGGKSTTIIIKRGATNLQTDITPMYDIVTKSYKLGLWVKDASSGIGTLTFAFPDGNFASLGHPVIDSKTGKIVPITGGNVYDCKITSIEKGQRGKAGEVRGVIDSQNKIGTINSNNKYGVYGKFDTPQKYYSDTLYEVASAKMIKPGKAQIVCTLSGTTPKLYDIEIIKAVYQSKIDDKGLIIRVTDEDLLELTGGIVQGMSGSPILQDNRLVGAVTHVFVNDPTKGYGIYAEWMVEALNDIAKNVA